jgi:hypothetical protein
MGITIHYHGKLDDTRVLPDLLLAARHFCFQRRWKYIDVDDRVIGKVERWIPSKGEEIKTVTSRIDDWQRGIIIDPHPESESVWLTFNQQGELCFYMPEAEPGHYWEQKFLFTKTQFAPLDVHISICELLHLIQDKYFPNLQVSDEGEYFETRDPAHLAQNFAKLNALMDRVAGALSDENSTDPIADAIRDAVDEAEGTEDKPRSPKKKKLQFERGAKIKVHEPVWKRGHGSTAGKN